MSNATAAAAATRPIYRCRGPRVSDEAIERKGCGAVLDKIIGAVKPDGKNHGIECPDCGNRSSVKKVPVEEVEEAEGE